MTDLFDFKPQKKVFAVVGNPVEHSKSPQIHQAFARQFDMQIEYSRTQVDPGGFQQAISHFSAHSGTGLNITIPFKLEAWQYCNQVPNELSERATIAEAVNTLMFRQDGTVFGDNTDGIGMVRDIQNNLQFNLKDKRILVIGAGGAVRGVMQPILDCMPAEIAIVNRTPQKARQLAGVFDSNGIAVTGTGFEQLHATGFDVIINGSATSLQGELPPVSVEWLTSDSLVYDMMYASQSTVFMTWAKSNGAGLVSDGLGMLVEQAAESFSIWNGQFPDTRPVISELRKL